MSLILDDKQAAMLRVSQQLRELALWLDAEQTELQSVPLDAWHDRLESHITAWDRCLEHHDLMPKGADAEREPIRRALERAASALSGAEMETELGSRLAARLDELATALQGLRPTLSGQPSSDTVEAMLTDFAEWRSQLQPETGEPAD